MKKMKVLFTLLMIGTSVFLFAQNERTLVAEFASADKITSVVDGKTHCSFEAAADKNQLEEIQDKAGSFGSSLQFTSDPVKGQEGKYTLSLKFDYEAPLTSIHKTLLFIGFTGVKIDAKEYPLDHLLTLKK